MQDTDGLPDKEPVQPTLDHASPVLVRPNKVLVEIPHQCGGFPISACWNGGFVKLGDRLDLTLPAF
jgi:hypothetical protein